MIRGTEFSIELDGVTYEALYHQSGHCVIVVSLYGERGKEAGKEPPLFVAKRLLAELVRRHLDEQGHVGARHDATGIVTNGAIGAH